MRIIYGIVLFGIVGFGGALSMLVLHFNDDQLHRKDKTMSMSTNVKAIKPPDEKWKAMKAVWDACKQAKVSPPADVKDFFEDEEPDEAGVIVDLVWFSAGMSHPSLEKWNSETSEGYEIDLTKLPAGVTRIRFYNSY